MKSNFDRKMIGKMPEGYIPGISRGCHGFITRSDVGPMMADITTLARDKAIAMQKERERARDPDRDDGASFNEINFDSWGGFQNVKLFQSTEYDEEDKEADETYATIDNYMGTRREKQREEQIKIEEENIKKRNPQAKDAMKDLLKEISSMSKQDWMSIPEAKNTHFKRPKREEKFTPVPDTLIADRLRQTSLTNALDAAAPLKVDPISGVKSSIGGNMSLLGDARRTILGLSLDQASAGANTQSRIDKSGYITALDSANKAFADLDIHDLHKARLLFKSMVESNPQDAKGWQGAARIEEMDGKVDEARNIIAQGIEECPDNEDVWSEAIRLAEYNSKKDLSVRAIKGCPKSIKLWIIAARLETETDRKVKVLKKALQMVPQSEKLWRELIDLSSGDEEAKEFLKSAVECVPDNMEFRLALARLCPYEEAKEVINVANRYFKSEERAIWVHASKLEESNGKPETCEILIGKGISKIVKKKNIFQRDENCEKSACLCTCRAIIKSVFQLDMKEHDFASLWIEDANLALHRGNKESARIMFDVAVELHPLDQRLWEGYIGLESRLEERVKYRKVLERAAAVEGETAQPFLLRLSKELVRAGEIAKAVELLKTSMEKQPKSEVLCLAYAEILKQLKHGDECRKLLLNARKTIDSVTVWRYHIKLERDLGNINKALEVSKEASARFPYNVDVACDLSTVYEEMNQFDKARENYLSLTKIPKCQKQSRPWIQYVLFENRVAGPQKARTIYEASKKYIKEDPEMWYTIIKLEERTSNDKIVKSLLAEAVKECPQSGELWAMMVESQPRAARIRALLNASEICLNDPYLMNVGARIFWLELKKEKAVAWFERSLMVRPLLGDTWVFYYQFYEEAKDDAMKAEILKRCVQAEPVEGRIWRAFADKPSSWSMSTEQILLGVLDEAKQHMFALRSQF